VQQGERSCQDRWEWDCQDDGGNDLWRSPRWRGSRRLTPRLTK